MRNKILKLAFRFSAFAFVVGMTGCDALDLAPIDTYGSGNFWTRKEHVIAYMDGIHKNFRDQIFQQQYVLGEDVYKRQHYKSSSHPKPLHLGKLPGKAPDRAFSFHAVLHGDRYAFAHRVRPQEYCKQQNVWEWQPNYAFEG